METCSDRRMKAIKILRCSDSMMWYRGMIGQNVVLARPADYDQDVYWSREPAGYLNIVDKSDAEIVTLENEDERY